MGATLPQCLEIIMEFLLERFFLTENLPFEGFITKYWHRCVNQKPQSLKIKSSGSDSAGFKHGRHVPLCRGL